MSDSTLQRPIELPHPSPGDLQPLARGAGSTSCSSRFPVNVSASSCSPCFAAVALGLAAIGVYGVVSYSVTQRRTELGIRMAVGADTTDVLKLLLQQGAKLTAWGVGVGLVSAAALGRVLSSQLYGVGFLDPFTFVGVAVGLSLVAMTATYLPAAQAAGIDPALALRGDRSEHR